MGEHVLLSLRYKKTSTRLELPGKREKQFSCQCGRIFRVDEIPSEAEREKRTYKGKKFALYG